ncbi:hypothetical protein [Stenotrophomonas sp. SORGH_AS_0321]|uniref:hypothetical protein n=1 Tax=Stenotrophomonas sp. SORGH_AS_0321 TaxID=3041787 RepID=UPI00285AA61E|nr:hypothetical protein [Stenotrophomonas sp. SORGH_AS_0321]MDR6093164.1 hypothetical protein [Stenotrophomonas sp. SORGH_AS_0321]
MNNASKGLSPQMALLLVQCVQGEEGVTLGDAQGALDRLVAAGTIRESYVDAVKATLMIPDDPKIAKRLIEDNEKDRLENLDFWYGNYAVVIYSSMEAGKDRDNFLLDASRVHVDVKEARDDANLRLGCATPPKASGSNHVP